MQALESQEKTQWFCPLRVKYSVVYSLRDADDGLNDLSVAKVAGQTSEESLTDAPAGFSRTQMTCGNEGESWEEQASAGLLKILRVGFPC